MRASLDGDTALVKMLISHPMESGVSKDSDGQIRTANFISEVDLFLNTALVTRVHTGPGISADPLFGWRLKGARVGDRIGVTWRDNQGLEQSFETTVQ
jgi:thiosulfate oxidation carrier complex protein SoxZ